MIEEKKKESHEIDFIKLGITVIKNWKPLVICLTVSAALGCVIALNTPKTYTAQVELAPEMSAGGMGLSSNLSDMAANFGIDIGNKSSIDAIYPELYPNVIASTDFIIKLFNVPVRLQDNDSVRTYKDHLTKDNKTPFWDYPKAWLAEKFKAKEPKVVVKGKDGKANPLIIPREDYQLCKGITSSITCLVDKKTSVITISVQDQDPMVAAIVADTIQRRLQEYITNYRTQKSRTDYLYYKKLADDSKASYIKAQRAYAEFSDANVDAELQTIQSKRDQLENEMQLRYNVYTQMQGQAQQAQAKIRERTPAFTIIQNAKMPYMASSTPRTVVVLAFMFLGVACDILWNIISQWRAKKQKKQEAKE